MVFPGDLEIGQAAWTLARAIPRVLARADVSFVFACRHKLPTWSTVSSQLRAELAAPLRSGHVVFVGETQHLRALLAVAALVALPAESSFGKMDIPLVLLEALAEETPVLVADVEPLREILGTDAARPEAPVGLAVPPLDPAALADAIVDLVGRTAALQAMGRAGRRWVERRFDARAMAKAHAAVYRRVLDRSARSRAATGGPP